MLWPPTDDSTGFKTLQSQDGHCVEILANLHEPAWWTGVRVSVTSGPKPEPNPEPDPVVHVQLVKPDGTPAIDKGLCEWFQNTNTWMPFPWAIPAAMATKLDLRLVITVVDKTVNPDEPVHISVRTCFHEMPYMPPRDKYLFVDDAGCVLHYWNGRLHMDGTPNRGYSPTWRTIHRVILPMWKWDDNKMFCIHGWDEIVP